MGNMQLRKKSPELGHQHEKRSGSQPSMCVQFWVPSQLYYVQSSLSYWNQTSGGGGGGAVALSPTQCVCKKGNCISLIEELLRMLKASASACRPVLRISSSCFAYPRRVFSTDYMFPTSVRKRMNPDIRGQAVPPFWLWVDVLGLIFLKDRRVSRDEPWIASTLSHSAAWNRASPFGMASIFPC